MVQVEAAGPRIPQTIEIVPTEIRNMAEQVLEFCTQGTELIGGFLTSDMTAMKNWVVSADTNLDDYYRK